jgi:hypothetical protein
MIAVVFAAIASALIAAIQTIDEHERAEAYQWVAGWCVLVLCVGLANLRWGSRPWDRRDHHPE